MKILILFMWVNSLASLSGFSNKDFSEFVLSKLREADITHWALVTDLKQRVLDDGYLIKKEDLLLKESNDQSRNFIKKATTQDLKAFYISEKDYMIILFKNGDPICALFHDGSYQSGAFSLSFTQKNDKGVLVGGRIMHSKLIQDKDEGDFDDRIQLLFFDDWGKSEFRKALFDLNNAAGG